eukprot:TRINITY_DN21352_c0_g1_i1.p1 TRINITY_DN21352_c0_g1~~TRINITY_DN21352_c0_g1_i1.p1  ORF type:complete len:261 (-),score=54.02 TRINITY_DN21352_c0_g1_i1:473-1255(-)
MQQQCALLAVTLVLGLGIDLGDETLNTPSFGQGSAGSTDDGAFLEKRSSMKHRVLRNLAQDASPGSMVADDFWALRDLLLIGGAGIFMEQSSYGHKEIQQSAQDLASMLPELHPVRECREMIQQSLRGESGDEGLKAAAAAAWACLPAKFNEKSFDVSYKGDTGNHEEDAHQAKMPKLRDESMLGACKGSQWPRTCSYWSSLHAMALRADALGLSQKFLAAVLPLLAGGATLCEGCTLHLRALHKPVLSDALLRDYAGGF